jgi:hypothetical protein
VRYNDSQLMCDLGSATAVTSLALLRKLAEGNAEEIFDKRNKQSAFRCIRNVLQKVEAEQLPIGFKRNAP